MPQVGINRKAKYDRVIGLGKDEDLLRQAYEFARQKYEAQKR
jgi:hypothetical protein